MQGKRFEEMEIGYKITTAGRTITETDIVNFIGLSGMFEELFTNIDYVMKESVYKQRIAPGALTFVVAEGLTIQTGLLAGTGMAFLGLNLKITGPTRCNDTIYVDVEVTDRRPTKDTSRGIVTFTHTVRNQEGQTIMTYDVTRMIKA